jgi:glycosyltransferase involved in cell wall biosynthesis
MNILHVFRAPVGGLFRHVRDLARGQSELGHRVGIICDSTTGGGAADALLASALPHCAAGIHRITIPRLSGFGDVNAAMQVRALARKLGTDVLHGHGAKGGVYARIAAVGQGLPAFYTPHGGSLHYRWLTLPGGAYLAAERALVRLTRGFIFVCEFERRNFAAKVGLAGRPNTVVHNGLWSDEFSVVPPAAGQSDVVFMGEMRKLKGVDVLLEALAVVAQTRPVTATLVGDGPDQAMFEAMSRKLGLAQAVTFAGRLPTREGLARGRLLVVPSRAESFPYVVLEAAAAQLPLIASSVGGIPEMLPEDMMTPPGEPRALARRIALALAAPDAAKDAALRLSALVATKFHASGMARDITAFYATARTGTGD